MKITVYFKLSEKGQKDAILQGKEPQVRQETVFSVQPTQEILSLCSISFTGEVSLNTMCEEWHMEEGKEKHGELLFDTYPTTFAEIVEKYQEFQEKMEKYKLWVEEKEKEKKKEEKEKKRQKEEWETEKRKWIAQYGSERLKLAIAEGYSAQKQYVVERTCQELGENAKVDYDEKAEWKERSCPSLEAIAIEKDLKKQGFQARTVWGYLCECKKYDCNCTHHEMVIVKNYLERYSIIVWES